MSGEFGSYCTGYLDAQIQYAADDLSEGRYECTRIWAGLLREFEPVAFAICRAEACDSGPDRTILAAIEALPRLRNELERIEGHLRVYEDVAKAAVRQHVAQQEERQTDGSGSRCSDRNKT